ncbi:MAG: branched-chain amino acid ABC transporter permease [Acidimicrobiia bacterium]
MRIPWRQARTLGAVLAIGAVAVLAVAAPAAAGDDPTATTTTSSPDAEAESINARLIDNSTANVKGIEGVRIVVFQKGERIGTGTSDADGLAVVSLPGPGTYEVRLIASTIPKGVQLTDPDLIRLPSVIVQPGQAKFVIFPFGQGGPAPPSAFDRLVDLAGAGLRIGLIVAVAATGLSLVFGTTGLINFAHGELLTFGALVAWFLSSNTDGAGITLVIAGILAVLIGGGLGLGLELGLWRRLRARRTGNIAMLVVSIGLALFLRSVYQIIFGSRPRAFDQYAAQKSVDLGPLDIQPKGLVSIGICIVILVVVALFLLRTRLGTAVRAVTDDPDLAESSGIDVQRVVLASWIACGMLAAAAGVLLGLNQAVEYDMGFQFLLSIFAVMILGGLGSPFGAMLAGVVLGLAFEVSTYWIPNDLKTAMYLGVMILVLLVRPQGLLGIKERVG